MCNCNLTTFQSVRYLPDGSFQTYCQQCGKEVKKDDTDLKQEVLLLIRADLLKIKYGVSIALQCLRELPAFAVHIIREQLPKKKRRYRRRLSKV